MKKTQELGSTLVEAVLVVALLLLIAIPSISKSGISSECNFVASAAAIGVAHNKEEDNYYYNWNSYVISGDSPEYVANLAKQVCLSRTLPSHLKPPGKRL